jgi:hypothetical protein
LWQAHSDLLSLTGVLVVAVALALANELSPDAAGSTLGHRLIHGVLVVCAALLIVALVDLIWRSITYKRASDTRWLLLTSTSHGVARIIVRARRSSGDLPAYAKALVLPPSGDLITQITNPHIIDGGSVFDTEPGDLEIDFPTLDIGRYELRVYGTLHFYELIRGEFELSDNGELRKLG